MTGNMPYRHLSARADHPRTRQKIGCGLSEYLDNLAAKSPVPGGGSAAALTGALAAALLSMAAKFTLPKAVDSESRRRISSAAGFAGTALRRLQTLMREDEEAYGALVEGLKKKNHRNMPRLYKRAANIPLEVCGIAAAITAECAALCRYCRTQVISDVVEAAILSEAAFLSAEVNVSINLRSIKDAGYKTMASGRLRSGRNKTQKFRKLVGKMTDVQSADDE